LVLSSETSHLQLPVSTCYLAPFVYIRDTVPGAGMQRWARLGGAHSSRAIYGWGFHILKAPCGLHSGFWSHLIGLWAVDWLVF
jgi:hypothetical protein